MLFFRPERPQRPANGRADTAKNAISAARNRPAEPTETRKKRMEDKDMTFWGHLEALRWVLIRVVAVLFLFMVVCFCAMPYLFDHIVLAPTTADFPLYRWLSKLGSLGPFFPDFSDDNYHVEIININVASQFLTHISTSFWFALVLMFPTWSSKSGGSCSPRCSTTRKRTSAGPSSSARACSSWDAP